jgi:NAD(P) transhydrogenase
MNTNEFDLIVIGSGPAGEMAAVQAGFLGKKVCLIERENKLGGAAANTGTLPSKTLRETALFLASGRKRDLYGVSLGLGKKEITADEFLFREQQVAESERLKIRSRLLAQDVEIITGEASFDGANTIRISGKPEPVTAGTILIATGSRPFRPPIFPQVSTRIFDSDTILGLKQLPATMSIVGAGVIGCEYACIFASLGVEVTLIHGKDELLPFLDKELQDNLRKSLLRTGIKLAMPCRVTGAEENTDSATLSIDGGNPITTETVLLATGRSSNTGALNLASTGVLTGKRDLVLVNEHYQTNIPNIYAAGDVIGFPALASTSFEQARVAIAHAFIPEEERPVSPVIPYGIYTIPECSMAGETEEQLIARGADYVTGHASYKDNARGLIIGEEYGLLKLLFEKDSRKLLGIHIIGEQATELIHTGMIALASGASADVFMHFCFNYPTLSELYKHAAYDAFGKPAVE